MIEIKDIEKLAHLARIDLPEDEKAGLAKEISSILSYVEQINKNHEAVLASDDEQKNIMRDDNSPHDSGIYTEKLLNAATKREGDYFKVKKIL